jgi:phosphatidylinositol alpha-1,6-mannosyltransferase
MNLLLVAQNYLPAVGGIEVHVRQVADGLVAAGHRVRVVATNFAPVRLPYRVAMLGNSLLAPTVADHDAGGIPVTALTPTGRTDRLRLLPAAVRAIPKLQRFAYSGLNRFAYRYAYRPTFGPRLRRLAADVDVVHSLAGGHIAWAAGEAARAAGAGLVVTPFVHPGQWGDAPDDVAFYRSADAVIGLVDTDTAYLASLGIARDRLHTIGVSPDLPPAADPTTFRQRHGLGNAPVVLYVGRMMAQKGAPAVLSAMADVWSTVPTTRFVFIGPASPAEAAQFDGVDGRAVYLGKVSGQEKADALAACDVFCMPSMSEILPTVYLEAWSYGRPVVGGRAHGLPELVEGNRAGLAVAQYGADVSAAILKLLDDPDLRRRFGDAGRRMVEAKYAVPAVTAQLLDVYRAVSRPAGVRAQVAVQTGA